MTDLGASNPGNYGVMRYISRWVPGDFIGGAGGPPILLPETPPPGTPDSAEDEMTAELSMIQELDDKEDSLDGGDDSVGGGEDRDSLEEAGSDGRLLQVGEGKEDIRGGGGGGGRGEISAAGDATAQSKSDGVPAAAGGGGSGGGETKGSAGSGFGGPIPPGQAGAAAVAVDPPGGAAAVEDDDDESTKSAKSVWVPIIVNDDFTDNPMYPFSVTEPTTLCITLYQHDRRWSVGRLGEAPRDIISSEFASRGERLASCMRYQQAHGFLVMRLNKAKMRITDFRFRKVVGCSDGLIFANTASCAVDLGPGRYAIIPYTNKAVSVAQEYILAVQHVTGQVEFEVQDLLSERPVDAEPSDDEGDDPNGEEGDYPEGLTDAEAAELDQVRAENRTKREYSALKYKPPALTTPLEWEYREDTEEAGVVSVFDEVCTFHVRLCVIE